MIRIKQAVVVEGKYDKIRLSAVIDAPIFTTGGFRIYKDKEKLALLRRLARQDGLLILTDSDTAGARIRGFLKSVINGGKIYHAYIPEILGKEKRKQTPSKQGLLGVEGMDRDVLCNALQKSGVLFSEKEKTDPVTRQDFYTLGLTGKDNSRALRQLLLEKMELPGYLSTAALVEAVNAMMDRAEFLAIVKSLDI